LPAHEKGRDHGQINGSRPSQPHAQTADQEEAAATEQAEEQNQAPSMILEVAILDVIPTRGTEFESAFAEAKAIIASMPGFVSLELQKCLEHKSKYVLLVRWKTLEDHTLGFRHSPQYPEWKSLLHHFYDPFPTVEHYEPVTTA
jgi:heme-degrading monooxygenase HmoA